MTHERTNSYVYLYKLGGRPVYVGVGTDSPRTCGQFLRARALSQHPCILPEEKPFVSISITTAGVTRNEALRTEAALIQILLGLGMPLRNKLVASVRSDFHTRSRYATPHVMAEGIRFMRSALAGLGQFRFVQILDDNPASPRFRRSLFRWLESEDHRFHVFLVMNHEIRTEIEFAIAETYGTDALHQDPRAAIYTANEICLPIVDWRHMRDFRKDFLHQFSPSSK